MYVVYLLWLVDEQVEDCYRQHPVAAAAASGLGILYGVLSARTAFLVGWNHGDNVDERWSLSFCADGTACDFYYTCIQRYNHSQWPTALGKWHVEWSFECSSLFSFRWEIPRIGDMCFNLFAPFIFKKWNFWDLFSCIWKVLASGILANGF